MKASRERDGERMEVKVDLLPPSMPPSIIFQAQKLQEFLNLIHRTDLGGCILQRGSGR